MSHLPGQGLPSFMLLVRPPWAPGFCCCWNTGTGIFLYHNCMHYTLQAAENIIWSHILSVPDIPTFSFFFFNFKIASVLMGLQNEKLMDKWNSKVYLFLLNCTQYLVWNLVKRPMVNLLFLLLQKMHNLLADGGTIIIINSCRGCH